MFWNRNIKNDRKFVFSGKKLAIRNAMVLFHWIERDVIDIEQ